jgi:hypothetical protein
LPQQINLKPVNTFNKGLITEATVMTFPEGASSDELNCDLLKNGARQRRRGIVYEDNYQTFSSVQLGDLVHTETWTNVSGIGGTEFLVVQHNNILYFFDKSAPIISAAQKSFSIDLYTYSVANTFNAASVPIQTASINGFLVITSPAIEPLRVEYITTSDSISVSKITINIRDFEYLGMSADIASVSRSSNVVTVNTSFTHSLTVGDVVQIVCNIGSFNGTFTVVTAPSSTSFTYAQTAANVSLTLTSGIATETRFDVNTDLYPSRITSNYQYDLYNMGWAEPGTYRASDNDYSTPYAAFGAAFPPRNKPWYIGAIVNSSGDRVYTDRTFRSTTFGKSLSPNGYYIVDFFNQNRSSVSGISGLATILEVARFSTTTAYAGRVWFAGLNSKKNGGKIFFSKVVESKDDIGKCYQVASPTAEDSAGVVDSDGGYIVIPEASEIQALFSTGSILYVMASNGIWAIGGVDQVFKATEYFVSKVSNTGIVNFRTLVNANGSPVFWDTTAIYTIQLENNQPIITTISDNIKTVYDNISNDAKRNASAVYDQKNKRIYWLYSDNSSADSGKKNNILILDLDIQAYFPWRISDTTSSTPYLLTGYYTTGIGTSNQDLNVVSGVDQVIDASSNTVVQNIASSLSSTSQVEFLVKTSAGPMTVATFSSRSFLDWGSADYSSYAETGYDFYGSATLKKNTPYITTYLKRTEQNFVVSGSGYTVDFPSSCQFLTKWDLSVDNSRWGNSQQIYRLMNYPIVDPSNLTFTYPYDTIVCRTKIRGKGRVMRLRFESEQGKDFYLIGWEIISGTNPRY